MEIPDRIDGPRMVWLAERGRFSEIARLDLTQRGIGPRQVERVLRMARAHAAAGDPSAAQAIRNLEPYPAVDSASGLATSRPRIPSWHKMGERPES